VGNDRGRGFKVRIYEQGLGGKFRIFDRGVGGGQNKLGFSLFLSI
jgi:hypothetical protein